MIKAIFCWSGGKDSAYCLYKVLVEKRFDVRYLLTTVNGDLRRVSMHGVREELLERQAEAIGIPLMKVAVYEGNNAEYERVMEQAMRQAKEEGIEHVIFGDIFLEDLRRYREQNLAKVAMTAVFPLWKMDTRQLIADFLAKGFKTVTCCVNDAHFGESWVGRELDQAFISELPAGVDACGENGEYHTFCYDGPLFNDPVAFKKGEKVYKPLELRGDDNCSTGVTKGFWFCDLEPI